jgi:hypothetical protein
MELTSRSLFLAPIALAATAIVALSFGTWVNVDFANMVLCYVGPCNPADVEGAESHRVATFVADGHLTALLGFAVLALTGLSLVFPAWSRHFLSVSAGSGLLAMAVGARVAFDTTLEAGPGPAVYDSATSGLYVLIAAGALVAILSVACFALESRQDAADWSEAA